MKLTRDEQDMKDDIAYQEARQREIDDAADKRAASGLSPEQLSLMDAANAGRMAGMYGHGASLNPYDHTTPEYVEWEKQRLAVIGFRLRSAA